MKKFVVNSAKLTLKINSIHGRQHIINALRTFAENLQAGIIKNGQGISTGSGLDEEWDYEEKEHKEDYTCEDAKKDIDFFFSGERTPEKPEQEEALKRALYEHMTKGSKIGKHNIACQKCWDYYQEMKRTYCGG